MFETIIELFAIMLTAITLENAVFSRGLGTNTVLNIDASYQNIALFGGATTVIIVIASVFSWILDYFLQSLKLSLYVKSIGYLCCICLTYGLIILISQKKFPHFLQMFQPAITLASFNTVVFASLLLTAMQRMSFLETIFFGIGTGIGYTGATLMVYIGREQLKFLNIPKSFKGLPIALVYIGLVSLSIYGLIGHQLPS